MRKGNDSPHRHSDPRTDNAGYSAIVIAHKYALFRKQIVQCDNVGKYAAVFILRQSVCDDKGTADRHFGADFAHQDFLSAQQHQVSNPLASSSAGESPAWRKVILPAKASSIK